MNTEKNYPNGMLRADYVFEMYQQLDPSEQNKFKEMLDDHEDELYYQANYTVNEESK